MPADVWREYAPGQSEVLEIKLAGTIDGVADLGPVHQVPAVEDRDARKPGEGRIDEIIIVADAGNARVGIEALQNRIGVFESGRLWQPVVAAIFEPVERCDR